MNFYTMEEQGNGSYLIFESWTNTDGSTGKDCIAYIDRHFHTIKPKETALRIIAALSLYAHVREYGAHITVVKKYNDRK